MAHLTHADDPGRGQIILIAGFALAVTLVTLALVMNAAIYTENLATRSGSVDASDAHAYHSGTRTAALDAFHYAHDVNNGTNSELSANVTDAMESYYSVTARQEARYGRIVNVSVGTTHGTNVSSNVGGNFQDANNQDDWDLAGGVQQTRQFTIHVDSSSSLAGPAADEFRVVADEDGGDGKWVLNMTEDSGVVTVGINDSGDFDSCQFNAASFWVNVSQQSITNDNGNCDDLDWGDRPGTYTLWYRNASQVTGRYSLILDEPVSSASYDSAGPRARDHLYSMTVDVVYRTDGLDYESEIRIAPGEHDD